MNKLFSISSIWNNGDTFTYIENLQDRGKCFSNLNAYSYNLEILYLDKVECDLVINSRPNYLTNPIIKCKQK